MAAEASTTAVAVYPFSVRLVCFIALLSTASVALADAASDEARRILGPSCPDCHTRSSAKSVAKALAVFDFDDAAFFQHMTPAQLDKAIGRLQSKGSADERARFGELVRAEKARRAAAR
jgi:hypothetical protein